MHTNRISPARKILLWLAAAIVLTLLPGCESVTLTNLTPASLDENPSQIYTFTLRITPRTNTVALGSIEPHIIVDGQTHEMKKSSLGGGLYEFEYTVAAGRDDIAYYYLVNYNVEGNSVSTPAEAYTEVAHAKITHRNVLKMEANRGPVGARISILGRGFTPGDIVFLSGTPARTVFESPNALSFFVPAIEAGKNYSVALNGTAGFSQVGTFRIDPSTVSVFPTSLTLRTGERQPITFTIPTAAPAGGTLLDIQTDVPEAVIMPEVMIAQGQTAVTIAVEGGKPATANLFLKGFSNGELTIPVTVTAK